MQGWYKDKIGRRSIRVLNSSLYRSIVLVDNLKNTALEFTTVYDLLVYLKVKTSSTAFVIKYIDTPKLYKKRYEFYYSENFTGVITNKSANVPAGVVEPGVTKEK
jgi:hypothetical protein